MAPAYVSELIAVRQAPRSLRSNNKLLLTVPRTHLKLKGDRALLLQGRSSGIVFLRYLERFQL